MLTDIAIKEKMSGFRHYSLLFFATVFFVIFSSHAGATEIKAEKSADLNSSANCCCSDNNSDPGSSARSKAKHDSVGSFCKPLCCPGPKGPQGPQGPQGGPACPGTLTDFASYQLIFLPGQAGFTNAAGTIPFNHQALIRPSFTGGSISSFPPFNIFRLLPGIYEISIGVSTTTANQVQLVVGTTTYTFPSNPLPMDFITFRKIVEIFTPTNVSVTTTAPVTFTPPATTTGIGAYINIVRIQ